MDARVVFDVLAWAACDDRAMIRESELAARTAGAEVGFDEGFWPSVQRLDSSDSHRVIQALNLFAKNPEHPNLHLKPLKGRLSQLMSVRAGRDVRVMLVRRGDTISGCRCLTTQVLQDSILLTSMHALL